MVPGAFKSEAIAGYEARIACEVLHQAEILDRPKGRSTRTVNGGKSVGKVYRMHLYQVMQGEEEEEGRNSHVRKC